MQIFSFVVMKTCCLRTQEEHILFNNLEYQSVGFCTLVLGPPPFRSSQLHCSLFPADSLAGPAQASGAQPLCLLPPLPTSHPPSPIPSADVFMEPWAMGVPRKFCACPVPGTPLFPCHHSMGKSNSPLCPPLTPAGGCPSRCPSPFFHHKMRLYRLFPHRSGPSGGQRRGGVGLGSR